MGGYRTPSRRHEPKALHLRVNVANNDLFRKDKNEGVTEEPVEPPPAAPKLAMKDTELMKVTRDLFERDLHQRTLEPLPTEIRIYGYVRPCLFRTGLSEYQQSTARVAYELIRDNRIPRYHRRNGCRPRWGLPPEGTRQPEHNPYSRPDLCGSVPLRRLGKTSVPFCPHIDSGGGGIGKEIGAGIGKEIGGGVGKEIGAGIGKEIGSGIGKEIGGGIGKEVGGGTGKETGGGIGMSVRSIVQDVCNSNLNLAEDSDCADEGHEASDTH
ncbi:Uncharacterized protein OBRU01_13038, partial [Operophtera brumata]